MHSSIKVVSTLLLVASCKSVQPVQLPSRCTSVGALQLTRTEVRRLSKFINDKNPTGPKVDIQSPYVCLIEVIAKDHIGLIYIESALSSHWAAQYFIHGRRGVSPIEMGRDKGQTIANVKAALADHKDDFSPEEAEAIIRHFEPR